jgi:hypothetical protein
VLASTNDAAFVEQSLHLLFQFATSEKLTDFTGFDEYAVGMTSWEEG